MAEFIVRHVPPDRPPKVADWNKFQRTVRHILMLANEELMIAYKTYSTILDGTLQSLQTTHRRPSSRDQSYKPFIGKTSFGDCTGCY
jgi:hypothetical protein